MKLDGKHMKTGSEAVPPTRSLRTKIGVAAAAGCLSLALIPAMAMAEPAGNMDQQNMGSQPPAMQQGQAPTGNFGGQAPMGQAPDGNFGGQAPMGQAPDGNMSGQAPSGTMPSAPNADNTNGQQPPAAPDGTENANSTNGQPPAAPDGTAPDAQNKELDEKIINAIDDEDVKAKALAGNPDTENKRPAIPEGEINIQQLIDSIRQAFMGVSQNTAPQLDGEAPADLPEGAPTEKPEGAPKDAPADKPAADQTDSTSNTDNASSTAPAAPQNGNNAQAPAGAPTGDDTSALDVFKQIFDKVLSLLKGE